LQYALMCGAHEATRADANMGISQILAKWAGQCGLGSKSEIAPAALPDYGPEPAVNETRRNVKHN
jgi:hypothetical protein